MMMSEQTCCLMAEPDVVNAPAGAVGRAIRPCGGTAAARYASCGYTLQCSWSDRTASISLLVTC